MTTAVLRTITIDALPDGKSKEFLADAIVALESTTGPVTLGISGAGNAIPFSVRQQIGAAGSGPLGKMVITNVSGGPVDVVLITSNQPVAWSGDGAGSAVTIIGTVPVSGPATNAQLRATPLPVSGPLTDALLRATPVPVSGPLTDALLRATPVPISGPLTDAQLRATPPTVALPTSQPGKVLSTAGVNETLVKAAPGALFGFVFVNLSGSAVYVKFYDKATAPVAGTDPVVWTIPVPAFSQPPPFMIPAGIGFAAGIGYAITGGLPDADTTPIGAGDCTGAIFWR